MRWIWMLREREQNCATVWPTTRRLPFAHLRVTRHFLSPAVLLLLLLVSFYFLNISSSTVMSAAAETAKVEVEAARAEILEHEKQIQTVKGALRQLTSASGAEAEDAPNTLEVAVLKVRVVERVFLKA